FHEPWNCLQKLKICYSYSLLSILSMEALLELSQARLHPSNVKEHKLLAEKAAQLIDDHGWNISEKVSLHMSFSSKNPLFEACRTGKIELVKVFIDRGVSLNVIDHEGNTPLFVALSSHLNSRENILKLISWGANVNLHRHGRYPLLCAFYAMDNETTKLLIRHGADVNNVILTLFCFVESLFAFNTGMVMMAAGVKFHMHNFKELLSLGSEIILAGLLPRTFYLSGKRFLLDGITPEDMADLWNFQYLCLILGFRVESYCLQDAIDMLMKSLGTETDQLKSKLIRERLEKLGWTREFLSQPLPLTYQVRIAVRRHLVAPEVSRGQHINKNIDKLPVPTLARDFLSLKLC
ncbi:unnamed protein product, partial [Lymnaea stagnalis]